MSEHVWAQENIAAYVAGGLEGAEGERLEAHLADCSACAQAVDEARALDRKLAPVLACANPGAALEDRIIRRLPTTTSRGNGFRLSGMHKAMLAAAAIVLLAVFGAGVRSMMDRVGSSNEAATTTFSLAGFQFGPTLDSAVSPTKFTDGTSNWINFSTQYSQQPNQKSPPSADDLARAFNDQNKSALGDRKGKETMGWEAHKESKGGGKGDGKNEELQDSLDVGTSRPTLPKFDDPSGNPLQTPPPSSLPAQTGMLGGSGFAGGGGMGMMGMGGVPPSPPGKDAGKGPNGVLMWSYTNNGDAPPKIVNPGYFKPGDNSAPAGEYDKEKGEKGFGKSSPAESKAPETPPITQTPPPPPIDSADKNGQKGLETPPKVDPPAAPRKIIIRSGELEFEIDSFDTSVATIMRLITSVKGAFVATINSDKLPNGKVRGSVVVRVPPDHLDAFVLDLRKELAKVGELKNQRIGSLDVTKMYTDLESRLRASRTMEERLLLIIKDGKGMIKDLLMAEKELGVWRTQIEELEGELRYYGNLASLGTLTIKLFEKDIRLAASVTENERIQAGIEVDDVEKVHQQALKAITDAKGRVTRSELKQHAAGQFNAILHFETSPEAAGPLRDVLKQLGNMVRLQIDRLQTIEAGDQAPRDAKVLRGQTHFLISIYNLANVAPRETVMVRLAVADVPAVYQKLREVVAKAKGHTINAQLDEKDRQNINAQLDFDVSRLIETEVQAALLGAGETLSRQVSRVPESDNVTDSKVMYRLTLIDSDSIQPRETVTVQIAAADVPAAYQKLRDALAKAKARVINANLNEQDRRNISANFDFTYRRSDESVVQTAQKDAGETLSRQVSRLPESPTLTDTKVLVSVKLIHAESLPARETVVLQIASVDVPGAYEKVRTAVTRAKGRIAAAHLNEQDRRNIMGKLQFDVPRAEEAAVREVLDAAGEALTRRVTRQQENISVTDTKVEFAIDLLPAAAILPRETTTLAMEVSNVAFTLKELAELVNKVQGRIVETQVGQERNGQVTARVVYDVPFNEAATLAEKFMTSGQVRVHQVTRDPQAPEGKLALGRLVVTLSNTPLIVPTDQSIWSQVRGGLTMSIRGLSVSAGFLIFGLLFVLPWALVLYAGFWLARRLWWRGEAAAVATAGPATEVQHTPEG